MMKFIREHLGKTFLVILVALMSFVFVIWGVFPELRGKGFGGGDTDVATVGDERVTYQELQGAVNRQMELYKSLGQSIPDAFVQNIKQQALYSIVNEKLMVEEGKRLGISPSDMAVREEIQTLPYFQDKTTKKFDVELYKKVLSANNLSPGQFEQQIRDQMTQQMVMKFLESRIRVTDTEMEREYRVTNEERNLLFVRIAREDAYSQMHVSDEELKKYLSDKANQSAVDTFYTQNQKKYNRPEEVCARHILLRDKTPAAASEKNPPKELLALHPTVGNFEAVAKKSSEDPGSKASGGDLGCFGKAMMDKAFEDTAFSQPLNTVSKPVHSKFGWHYILVYKKNPAIHKSLEEVRNSIAEELMKRGRFEEVRKINQATADAVAKSWPPKGAKADTTGFFNRLEGKVPKIGTADEIVAAAFDPNAKVQKGPQIFESQGAFIVASVKESKSADMKKYAESKTTQFETLRERKLRAFMPAWMDDVRSRIKVSLNQKVLSQM